MLLLSSPLHHPGLNQRPQCQVGSNVRQMKALPRLGVLRHAMSSPPLMGQSTDSSSAESPRGA